MNFNVFLLLLLSFPFVILHGQSWDISFVSNVNERVEESSGLVKVDGRWITHNDSGNSPHLFELDITTGEIVREVMIGNQSNVDWEAICVDKEFIYIGDFGNNLGNRRNLRVLKVSISDFLSSDTVQAAAIEFEYSDQTDFTSSQFQTNFDAETMISYGDSLYVFTKNWGDFKSNIYPLPKDSGSYIAFRYDSLDANFMLTGGDADLEGNLLGLVGYNFTRSFFLTFPLDQLGRLHLMQPNPQMLITQGSYQVEALGFDNSSRAYVSSENSFAGPASLYVLSNDPTSTFSPGLGESFSVYPNPSNGFVYFSGPEFSEVRIVSSAGECVRICTDTVCFLSSVSPGQYIALFYNEKGLLIGKEKLIFH